MSILLSCPTCGKTISAPDSAAGKRALCPQCRGTITIPGQVLETEIAHQSSSLSPDADVESEDSTISPDEGPRKPCPMCGEMIMANAMKCRFCNEVFDPALKKKLKTTENQADQMTTGDWVVAILCSTIGCIIGLVWTIQGRAKGPKMIGISILSALIINVIVLLLNSLQNR